MTAHAKATYEELDEQLRRLRTELHSLRWILGLETHEGSGTTALVARRLGRKSIGIELNEEYAQLAATRLQQLSLLA